MQLQVHCSKNSHYYTEYSKHTLYGFSQFPLQLLLHEEQEAAGETNEDLFVFSSEEAPEFNDTPDEAMAATENAQNGVCLLYTSYLSRKRSRSKMLP